MDSMETWESALGLTWGRSWALRLPSLIALVFVSLSAMGFASEFWLACASWWEFEMAQPFALRAGFGSAERFWLVLQLVPGHPSSGRAEVERRHLSYCASRNALRRQCRPGGRS
jgi:hypothetical protein